jgi:hypothetical protein
MTVHEWVSMFLHCDQDFEVVINVEGYGETKDEFDFVGGNNSRSASRTVLIHISKPTDKDFKKGLWREIMTNWELQMKVERCHGKVKESFGYAFYELAKARDKLTACIWWEIWYPIWCGVVNIYFWKTNKFTTWLFCFWSGKRLREWY